MYKSWMWKQRSYREQFDENQAGGVAAEQQQEGEQQAEGETPEGEQQADQQGQGDAEDDEVVITIGDEAPPATADDEIEGKPAPAWVKELRKENRDLKKRQREYEQAQQASQQQAAAAAPTVGEKPTLEGCDYDAEAYAEKLVAWNEGKRKVETAAAAARQEQEAAAADWTKTVGAYRAAGAALKVGSFEDAEATVIAMLDPTQQAILVQAPTTPQAAAQLVAALANSPGELKKLAGIKNAIKYTVAVAELVGKLKVQPRKQPPPAERQVRGGAGGATGVDNARDRLVAEADRTGDRSKVIAYDRDKRRKQAA